MSRVRPYRRLTDRFIPRGYRPRAGDFELVVRINRHAQLLSRVSQAELRHRAQDIRAHVQAGTDLCSDAILVPTFALAKEAARRELGTPHFDVQILAGIALSLGAVAEMQTGEGKTLASTLPAILHGMQGGGVHVGTVNAYLAARDYEQLRPLYESLGLTVGLVRDGDSLPAKQAAYDCDITYATGYELGFDFLRDQVALRNIGEQPIGSRIRDGLRGSRAMRPQVVQRRHAFAIIDEVDSVLIDEAAAPLVLSSHLDHHDSNAESTLRRARDLARELTPETHYFVDRRLQRVMLTDQGTRTVYAQFAERALDLRRPWQSYIENALAADHLFQRDMHYVVRGDRVSIVDTYTGRICPDRSWRRGLHQAIEVKEGLAATRETSPVASISRQRFFQLYDKLCGMTGTASGHEAELLAFYGLPVVRIPVRRPCQRRELPTTYFATSEDKWQAIALQAADRYRHGQPVLIGTITISDSRCVGSLLAQLGVPFRLLNGVQDEDEASLIATAGEVATVTVATNMAGRGTDIQPTPQAVQLGGLHVMASARHHSRRIDRQLAGRAARQGDPGSSQVFVSAEDSLIRAHSPTIARNIRRACVAGPCYGRFDQAMFRLQREIERENFEQRRELLQHEQWLDNLRSSVA